MTDSGPVGVLVNLVGTKSYDEIKPKFRSTFIENVFSAPRIMMTGVGDKKNRKDS